MKTQNEPYDVKQSLYFVYDLEPLSDKERRKVTNAIHTLNRSTLPIDHKDVIPLHGTEDIQKFLLGNSLVLVFKKTRRRLYLIRVSDVVDIYEWGVRFAPDYNKTLYPDT